MTKCKKTCAYIQFVDFKYPICGYAEQTGCSKLKTFGAKRLLRAYEDGDACPAYKHRDEVPKRGPQSVTLEGSFRPGKYRDRVLRLQAEGYKGVEIAQILGCGKNTVYRILGKAGISLRRGCEKP